MTHFQKKKKKQTRMRLLLVVMLVVLFLIINGSNCRISGANEEAQARNKNHINRSNIYKTIRTRIGDVFDCVDIYKQPSLDHSLLKNHKIQLNPNLNLKETTTTTKNTTSVKYAETELQISGGCPTGSVPIHRLKKTNTKDNITWSRGTYDHWISLDPVNQGYFYGAKALINLHNPSVAVDQFTSSQIWVQSSYDGIMEAIEAGWVVHPKLFGDNRTRLFGHWTSDGYLSTGCFNILCPGFVQVHSTVALGDAFTTVSVYGGDQYVMTPMIYHDPESEKWWLVMTIKGEDVAVGYWPRELFYELADHAKDIRFGGVAGAEENRPSPPMGNGYLPMNDFHRSCYMANMKKVDERQQIVDFDDVKAYTRQDIPTSCYGMQYFGKTSTEMEISILFGGPGGNC